jgi:hypothetical protein
MAPDPAATLQPMGEAWVGIVVPGLVLAVSVAVSAFLYWRFVRARS